MGSNPFPPMLIIIFQNNESIQVKFSTCLIFILIIQYSIETINYKDNNPQVYLMGSNPNPEAIVLISFRSTIVFL
jgi:hypothetical protein